jgi:hypothetical protein
VSSFSTVAKVSALIAKNVLHSAGTKPSDTDLQAVMDGAAARIRGVLASAGYVGDPPAASALLGMCVDVETYFAASTGILMHTAISETDLARSKAYREAAVGKDEESGILAAIAVLAIVEAEAAGSTTTSAVGPNELTIDQLNHLSTMQT